MERSILPAIAEQEFSSSAHGGAVVHRRVRRHQGADELPRGALVRSLRAQARARRRLARRRPVPFLLMWAPSWAWILFANAAARREPGAHLVDDGDHEDRPRGAEARAGDGPQRVRGVLRGRGSRPGDGLVAARHGLRPQPFYLGVGSSRSGSAALCSRARDPPARRARVQARGAPSDAEPARGLLAHDLARPQPGERQPGGPRQQPQRRHGVGPVPLFFAAAQHGPRQIGCSRRSTRRPGARADLHRRALGSRRPQVADRRRHVGAGDRDRHHHRSRAASPASPSAPRCSASARRWSTRPARGDRRRGAPDAGARRRSASIGCGATSATPSARCSRGSPPTRSGSPPRCGSSPALTLALRPPGRASHAGDPPNMSQVRRSSTHRPHAARRIAPLGAGLPVPVLVKCEHMNPGGSREGPDRPGDRRRRRGARPARAGRDADRGDGRQHRRSASRSSPRPAATRWSA
jgi:hypothetical protein